MAPQPAPPRWSEEPYDEDEDPAPLDDFDEACDGAGGNYPEGDTDG